MNGNYKSGIDFRKIKGLIALVVVAVIVGALAIDAMEPVYGLFGKVPTGQVGIVTVFGKVKDVVLEEAGSEVRIARKAAAIIKPVVDMEGVETVDLTEEE